MQWAGVSTIHSMFYRTKEMGEDLLTFSANTLVLDDPAHKSACFHENGWHWLYTGITRAAERLKVVQI
jgi:hypothetical protein